MAGNLTGANGAEASAWLPDVLGVEQAGHSWRFALQIGFAAPVFSGHFPDLPILPGVAQLHWAGVFYQRYSGDARVIRGVRRVKFQRIVGPGDRFELSCELRRSNELHFVYVHSDGERMSTGQLLLQPRMVEGVTPDAWPPGHTAGE